MNKIPMIQTMVVALEKLKVFTLLCVCAVLLFVSVFPVSAKTIDELEKEISEKEKELESLGDALEDAQNSVQYYNSKKNSSASQLEQVKNELAQIEAEMEVNSVEMEKVKQELELIELDLEQKGLVMEDKMIDFYIYQKQGIIDMVLENGGIEGFWKDVKYRETLLDNDFTDLNLLVEQAAEIKSKKDNLGSSLSVLEEESERLAAKKEELAGQIAHFSSMAAYNTDIQSGIRAQMGGVQQQVDGLTAQQQEMIAEETGIIKDAHGGTKPLVSGEYYFYGRGRSLYQGHGLGFSQYGAKGGGQNGMSAQQIATFYYTGSSIGNFSENINVVGYGWMNIEDYVSGLGEVPDYACGTQEQYSVRPDKYRVYNPGLWEGGCWPEEAIKAQVIVARSYGAAFGGAICTSAACQVYKGGQNKRWAANETSGQVLKVGGSIIKAYYSSDNNNGWGTGTHRNPIWCWDFHGYCGAGFSWLQAVNDSSFAAKGPYTDWVWRTNSYSISELQSMLEWYANAGYSYPSSSEVRNLLNKVGTLQRFEMQKDVSGRVARIVIVGSANSDTINGDFFKMIWNFWVGNVQLSGEVDPIFSLTYHFVRVP